MLEKGAELNTVDLNKGLSVEELDRLIGKRDYLQFLNSRNALFREMDMKTHPPPREDALRLMSENPNLIKRPIVKKGNKLLLGFDAAALGELLP